MGKEKPTEILWKLQQLFQKNICGTVLPTDKLNYFDNCLLHIAKENNINVLGLETDSIQLSKIIIFQNGIKSKK